MKGICKGSCERSTLAKHAPVKKDDADHRVILQVRREANAAEERGDPELALRLLKDHGLQATTTDVSLHPPHPCACFGAHSSKPICRGLCALV